MNIITLHLTESVKIEVDNSFSGEETITYNGEIVSKKKSLLGDVHSFTCQENGEQVQYEVRIGIKNLGRISVAIYRNNKVILLS